MVVMGITESQSDYATIVADALKKQGFRVELDLRNEKISYKIREHSLQKLPYQIIVGDKEKAGGLVAVRARGEDLGQLTFDDFVLRLRSELPTE
jgi:threonyl-tRNA synthetase